MCVDRQCDNYVCCDSVYRLLSYVTPHGAFFHFGCWQSPSSSQNVPNFITGAGHQTLSYVSWIQSSPRRFTTIIAILILSFWLRLGFTSGLFDLGFSNIFLSISHCHAWCAVQIMKLLLMCIFPFSCDFFCFRAKYFLYHPVLYVFFPQGETNLRSFTLIQNNGQHYMFVYFYIQGFRQQTGRQQILDLMANAFVELHLLPEEGTQCNYCVIEKLERFLNRNNAKLSSLSLKEYFTSGKEIKRRRHGVAGAMWLGLIEQWPLIKYLKAHQMVEWEKAQTETAIRCREWFTIAENEEVDAKGK